MRIDHHAYQRATRVAGIGFMCQLAFGLVLLLFNFIFSEDTALLHGAVFVLVGLLAWLGLILLFNQHKLEQLEALEHEEIDARRSIESVFDPTGDEVRVAARRLRLMYRWLMPITSLLVALTLGSLAWWMLRRLGAMASDQADYHLSKYTGWAVAICLGFSALSFIISRFVAGMAKQPAWQNLRGGAAYMVGNAIVTLAIAVGQGFRFFNNNDVIEAIAYAIPVFMVVIAAEVVLNFILNLYRPRVAGELPRPAFDSKLLSLFSAPDNLVRSINEAVNYQFGFDIAGSWGYQLLLRSFARLLAVGAIVLMVLNMLVIVEPHEQAVKLSRGRIVDDRVYTSGVTWKLPWPLQTAEKFDVSRIRTLHLTSAQVTTADVQLWTKKLGHMFDAPLVPFIVGRSQLTRGIGADVRTTGDSDRVAANLALMDIEVILHYRIREDGGLRDYLSFTSDLFVRRDNRTMREKALRSIALRETSQLLSGLSIDEALGRERAKLPSRVTARVQAAFDANRTGIEVVAVNMPLMRPAGDEQAGAFEELSISREARLQTAEAARQQIVAGYAQLVGDPARMDALLAAEAEWRRLRDEHGGDAPETVAQRMRLEGMIMSGGGEAAQIIAEAERDRWVSLIDARAEASRLRGQTAVYRAAPRLYRERQRMNVISNSLGWTNKYILCVDPARVDFDLDLTELNTMLNIGDIVEDAGDDSP
jgi:regulator of protease activity HflC (stomatin/prohibitin superfamily)